MYVNINISGVVFHEHMDFIECANYLADAAGRALGAVISKFRKLKNIRFLTFTKLFIAMVIPVMDYSAGVWGFKYYHKCNRVQTRALSYFVGVHNRAPVVGIQGDVGWILPKYRRLLKMLQLWNHLLSLDENRLTKHIFEWEYANNFGNGNSWIDEIKQIFQLVDREDDFNNLLKVDLKYFSTLLYGVMEREWQREILVKPKLRTYITFKNLFKEEEYLSKMNTVQRARDVRPVFGPMLGQHSGRWASIGPALGWCPVFAGRVSTLCWFSVGPCLRRCPGTAPTLGRSWCLLGFTILCNNVDFWLFRSAYMFFFLLHTFWSDL